MGTCDNRLAQILAEQAPLSLAKPESWGVPFEKRVIDTWLLQSAHLHPRMHIIKRHSKPILETLVQRLSSTKVKVLEETMVVDLLIKDNTCYGALLIDNTGKLISVRAAAVVLASGGGGQLFKLNLNPPDITADGYAIALRAGAEIINMEFIQAGLGLVYPISNILNCWVWFLHPKLINRHGEEFLPKYLPAGVDPIDCMNDKTHHFPFSCRDLSRYIEVAVIKEINAGNSGPHGGVYLDFRNIDLAKVSPDFITMWQTTKTWYKQHGVDPDTQLLEVAPFGHAINGGLRVGVDCESTVKNLFAAGEVAGGPHGTDRLGGNMIVGCQVFGKIAGRAAAGSITAAPKGTAAVFDLNFESLKGIYQSQGTIRPLDIKQQIRNLMSANFLIVRNEQGLTALINQLQQRLGEIETDGFKIDSALDLIQALECRNMLETAIVMAKAALNRNESRGSHFRVDAAKSNPEFENIIAFQKRDNVLKSKIINPNDNN